VSVCVSVSKGDSRLVSTLKYDDVEGKRKQHAVNKDLLNTKRYTFLCKKNIFE